MDEMMNSGVNNDSDFTPLAMDYLKRIGRWTRFFSIFYFVLLTLFVVGGFGVMGSVPNGIIIGVIYIIIAGVLFFPNLYLYQSSQAIHQYGFTRDRVTLEKALQKQHSYWYFMGMLVIIYIVLCVLGLILFFTMYSSMKSSL